MPPSTPTSDGSTRQSEIAPSLVAPRPRPRLRLVPRPPLRVADVTMFYGERSGGIRTYLDAKLAWNAQARAYDHHLVVPGPRERHAGGRHELPSIDLRLTNGYRVPRGTGDLARTLRALQPDVVLLHDPFWGPLRVTRAAHDAGACVVAVGHGSSELDARGIPGPAALYAPVLRAWMTRAWRPVDAIMSVVDTRRDSGREATIPLRLGLHEAFVPQDAARRGDHVLYVGRYSKQKGVFRLLEAAALSREPWPLVLIGAGPAEDAIRDRARRLGIEDRVELRPYVSGRPELARQYASAACVVMPGEHETFGLVALEAAASGARVVCCTTAPSGRACGELAETFRPGDAHGLTLAIERARAARRDLAAARSLADRHAWPALFAAEHEALQELAERGRS